MKILQKMAMIVMVIAVAGNADGMFAQPPVLHFDTIVAVGTNIPDSFQPKWFIQGNGGAMPADAYVYFTVIPGGGVVIGNVPFAKLNLHAVHPIVPAVATLPAAGDTNIYFPEDGHQPTTPEAAAWSCANVNDPRITDWYMQMFGVIPFQSGRFIKAGWNDVSISTSQEIMTFPSVPQNAPEWMKDADRTPVTCPYPHCSSMKDLFIEEFKRIASNPIGRTLLYRILIEIRRRNNGGIGELENIPTNSSTRDVRERNRSRSISIFFSIHKDRQFAFNRHTNALIYSNTTVPEPSIGERIDSGNATKIIFHRDRLEVSLFHEMVHWYQWLRDPERATREENKGGGLNFSNYYIGRFYWDFSSTDPIARSVSESVWVVNGNVNFDDMRVILGMPERGSLDYKQGDDLSENSFRQSIGIPLRFGYTNRTFYEDNAVIDKILSTYGLDKDSYIPAGVGYLYNASNRRNGLGSFQINP